MLKVLVIDDEEVMRKSISESLDMLDIQTYTAQDPASALEITRTEKPGVVYIDYYLPQMNGVELMHEIKKIVPEALIFFVSATQDEKIISEAVETGALKFLTKPFSRCQIRDCLTDNLKVILKDQKIPHIFVVDDEEDIVSYFPRYLNRRIQCHVQVSRNGQEAYKILKENQFDILILDIRLPGMTGFDVLEKLPGLTKETHVIIISGFEGVEHTIKADQFGVKDIFHKPVNIEQFWKHLEQILIARNMLVLKNP